ncbi:MAG: YeeE/YedE thiosulfate transporter family protein [Hyphomicrobiaceae bacterium]|nr:YeeE/YedE thiosulfate transporter family protein [Hyphomicrobiaceae bacterium]
MTEFTPGLALAGGAIIGVGAVLTLLLLGRIAGISGILGGVVWPSSFDDWAWRAAFVAGMVLAPLVYAAATGSLPVITVTVDQRLLVVGGLLVGIGVTFGAGCASGHGVCGLARLSPRSIVATLTFMATAGITVYATRHLIGA